MATRTRQTRTDQPDTPADSTSNTTTNGDAVSLPSLSDLGEAPASLSELRRKPNPYAGVTLRSDVLDADKPRTLPVANDEQAKEVTKHLRNDATANKVGLSVDTRTIDGQMYVVFKSKSTKRNIEHTSAMIREWALSLDEPLPVEVGETTNRKGEPTYSKAIPVETRDAYRRAHKLPAVARKTS